MGTVHKAMDALLQREVAIKICDLSPLQDGHVSKRARRFLKEARVTAELSHPGIVSIHDISIHPDGLAYYTMDLVRGRTMTKLVDEGAWEGRQWIDGFLDVLGALHHGHSSGVTHGDLSLNNIMFSPDGRGFLMDWELAQVGAEASTPTEEAEHGTLGGTATVPFLSPQRAAHLQLSLIHISEPTRPY